MIKRTAVSLKNSLAALIASIPFFFPSQGFSNQITDYQEYTALIDDCSSSLPDQNTAKGFFSSLGTDRGKLNEDYSSFFLKDGKYYVSIISTPVGGWSWSGLWWHLLSADPTRSLDFSNVYSKSVLSPYQGQVTSIMFNVAEVKSKNSGLTLKVQFKNSAKRLLKEFVFTGISNLKYPHSFICDVSSLALNEVSELVAVVDYAYEGDTVAFDSVTAKVKSPKIPSEDEAFLWGLGWLFNNFDESSYTLMDSSRIPAGDFINMTATAKFSMVIYAAYCKGMISSDTAVDLITGIANSFIKVFPRGPIGINQLWPHFLSDFGKKALSAHVDEQGRQWAATEYGSGDFCYAAADLLVALQLIGDPKNQIQDIEKILQAVNWLDLISPDNYLYHGYYGDGNRIPYKWQGFGAETLGVNLVVQAATKRILSMDKPPTDNGCGFIMHACYPLYPKYDRYGNNWSALRAREAEEQILYYQNKNDSLYSAGLFGLSAAEVPTINSATDLFYQAYGLGGKSGIPVSTCEGLDVITPHYCAMISDICKADSIRMYEQLRDCTAPFLKDRILLSPLNNVESMAVSREGNYLIVNQGKMSWNLVLWCQGWSMSWILDGTTMYDLINNAIIKNEFLGEAWNILSNCQNWNLY